MDLNSFRYNVSRMSPLRRAFVSAALGVGAFGAVVGVSMIAPALGTVAGLAASLGGSIFVSSYSDPTRGSVNILGAHVSKDSLLNVAAFFGSYIFAAPKIVGFGLGLAFSMAHGATIQTPAAHQAPVAQPAAPQIQPPAPLP